MAGLFEKARVLFLANAHKLLDAMIDLDSVSAVKQYARDLEESLMNLEDAAAEGKGYVRTLTREAAEFEARSAELNRTIDLILTDSDPSNDHVATAKQVELDGVDNLLALKRTELEEATKTAERLREAVSALRAKHTSMVHRIQQLEAVQRATKAQEGAASAMKIATDIMASGETVSVDNIMERMRRKADVAAVKFEDAMGSFDQASGKDAMIAVANAKIAERRKRLATQEKSAA
jgi:phage shock protein A